MPRPCCRNKRSENDALKDSETGVTYCGTCWQAWISAQPRASASPQPKASTEEPDKRKGDVLVADDEELGEIEGVTHIDGTLYLLSRRRGLVFHADRGDDGRLRRAGVLLHSKKSGQEELHLDSEQDGSGLKEFPFVAQVEDHCETPFFAYEDLAPVLEFLSEMLGKTRKTLRIWDPYYCAGGVKRNFARLGFSAVHNECDDFYSLVQSKRQPVYDCIVTNPPYSTEPVDHVERLVKILCNQHKPWFVVQPNYVYTKTFWEHHTSLLLPAPRPFFLTPATPRKYKYQTPSGLRLVAHAQQLKTSPFVSMWYCWLGPRHTEKLYRWIVKKEAVASLPLKLACTEYFLPDSFKDSNDKTRRKPKKAKKRNVAQSFLPSEISSVNKRKRKRKQQKES